MASRVNKQSTVTFTLPVSCQICLGKVKQPVLCPNLHVFCHLCLNIWLQKNRQCPACRVEINDDNPVKHIIGGQLEDEFPDKQSTPELRKARFDLLYYEYEDQFEKLRKENIVLRTENSILLAQLNDAEEEKKRSGKGREGKTPEKKSSVEKEGAHLVILTKDLQEAQKLYAELKTQMGNIKKENSKLKDENISLTHENQNLRLELAQRSPKKFGRFTVATLETKISEQDKEIHQLTKALERSDNYIEELEHKLKKYADQGTNMIDTKKEIQSATVNMWPSSSTSRKPIMETTTSKEITKKNLFGKSNVGAASKLDLSKEPAPTPANYKVEHIQSIDTNTKNILKPVRSYEMDFSPAKGERTPKKVHFSVDEKPKEASSFQLEHPSPLDKPLHNSRLNVLNNGLVDKTAETGLKPNENYSTMSDAEFRKRINNLLKDHESDLVATSKTKSLSDKLVKSSNLTSGKIEAISQMTNVGNDSSNLSLPESGSLDTSVAGNLDFSLTPEMTDCIELMNRAEKKAQLPFSSVSSVQSISAVPVTSAAHQISATPSLPSLPYSASSYTFLASQPSSSSQHPVLSSSWQQQFYGSLKSYPLSTSSSGVISTLLASHPTPQPQSYKFTEMSAPGNNKDVSSERRITTKDFQFREPEKIIREFVSLPPSASIMSQPNFKFSEPFSYLGTSISNPYSSFQPSLGQSSSVSTSTSYLSKPPLYMNQTATCSQALTSLSTLPHPISSSTPDLLALRGLSVPPLTSSHGLSETVSHKGRNPYLNSSLDSILSPSLNSSQLNWPDESQRLDNNSEDTITSLTSN